MFLILVFFVENNLVFSTKNLELVKLQAQDSSFKMLPVKTQMYLLSTIAVVEEAFGWMCVVCHCDLMAQICRKYEAIFK